MENRGSPWPPCLREEIGLHRGGGEREDGEGHRAQRDDHPGDAHVFGRGVDLLQHIVLACGSG